LGARAHSGYFFLENIGFFGKENFVDSVDEKFSIFSDLLGKYLIFLGKFWLSWEKFRFFVEKI
jgi:hypothetical protein